MYTDIHMDGDDYILIREQDVIAIMPTKSECASVCMLRGGEGGMSGDGQGVLRRDGWGGGLALVAGGRGSLGKPKTSA